MFVSLVYLLRLIKIYSNTFFLQQISKELEVLININMRF